MECARPASGDGSQRDLFRLKKYLPQLMMTFAALCLVHDAGAVVVQAESFINAFDATAGNAGTANCTNSSNVNVDIETTSDAGGGCNVGWVESGEWLEYSINVPAGGYRADVRVASMGGGGSYNIQVDGVQVVAATSVGNTGGWQSWVTQSSGVFNVGAGTHTLRINVSGAMNLNWIDIVPVASSALPRLRQQGAFWVDQNGTRVDLRGLNLGNWLLLEFWMMSDAITTTNNATVHDQCTLEGTLTSRFGHAERERLMDVFRDSWMTDRDWDRIAALGFNVVRLPFIYNLIENENAPYTLRPDAWQYLDQAIAKAAQRGIHVILDLHGAVGSQGHEAHSGCSGRNWYWSGGNGQPASYYQDRTRWLWQQIAQRYRDNNTVAAYGLLNEPWGTDADTLANNLYYLAQQVRAVDANKIVILHGHNSGINAFGNPASRGFSNMAFEMHFYPGLFGWRDNDDPTVVHSDWLHCSPQGTSEVCAWNASITNLQTPFLIGEFQPWTELSRNGGEITRKTFDIYSMYGWASTAWSYKTTSQSGNTGDGNTGWPWGIVTNTTGYGNINVSTASAAQIESWFRQFATQGLSTHSDIAYWMSYQPTVGSNIEAEHFTAHRGTRIEVTSDPLGGDFNSSHLDSTDYMTYRINMPQSGTYRLEYRVASPTGGTVILGRDGVDLATTTVPNTAGYQNWQTISTTVSLRAGTQFLTVYVQAGGWNLNWWRLTPL
jgi:aryl-phospho-beta-D-glucosidase BglC (GH1 family)